eukprot:2170392-Rhodomonas_salina.1
MLTGRAGLWVQDVNLHRHASTCISMRCETNRVEAFPTSSSSSPSSHPGVWFSSSVASPVLKSSSSSISSSKPWFWPSHLTVVHVHSPSTTANLPAHSASIPFSLKSRSASTLHIPSTPTSLDVTHHSFSLT